MLSDKQLRAIERRGDHIGSHIITPYDPKYLEIMQGTWFYTSFQGVAKEDRRKPSLRVTRAIVCVPCPEDNDRGLYLTTRWKRVPVKAEDAATPTDFVKAIAETRRQVIKDTTGFDNARELRKIVRPHEDKQGVISSGWVTLPVSVVETSQGGAPLLRFQPTLPAAKPSRYKALLEAAWLTEADRLGLVTQVKDVQAEVKPLMNQFKKEVDRLIGWTDFMGRKEYNRCSKTVPVDHHPYRGVLFDKGISIEAWNLLPAKVATRIGEELSTRA